MRRQILRLFILLAALGLSLSALTAEVAPRKQRFTIGVQDYQNYLPYSEYKDGAYSGLGRAILDAFAQAHGYSFDYRVYPLKRRDLMFARGEFDFSFPDNPNWVPDLKRGLNIHYTPMLEFTDGVLVLPENLGKGVNRINKLGIPLGFTPYPFTDLIKSGAVKVTESAAYDSLYLMLLKARIDGAYANIRVASYYWANVEKNRQATFVFDPKLPHSDGFHFLATIKQRKVLAEFAQFLHDNPALIASFKNHYRF
ncbi:MAG: hypothetical protein WA173_05115 [Pseudomonas sp.]|uniref:hypothetical protein n=1 Tax=Pseudomonas sp. TaxID=306 RepID=UPI003BB6E754